MLIKISLYFDTLFHPVSEWRGVGVGDHEQNYGWMQLNRWLDKGVDAAAGVKSMQYFHTYITTPIQYELQDVRIIFITHPTHSHTIVLRVFFFNQIQYLKLSVGELLPMTVMGQLWPLQSHQK
jgi:hypothetical protein